MANDLWRTPPEVIDWIEDEFGEIKIDLCASKQNAISEFYLDERDDFLKDSWIKTMMIDFGDLAFCNPPYSNPLPFVNQCIKWSKNGYGVVMLLNNDCSTRWFNEIINKASIITHITNGRIAFLDSDGRATKGNNKPQLVAYFAPFGRVGDLQTKYVSINEITKIKKDN